MSAKFADSSAAGDTLKRRAPAWPARSSKPKRKSCKPFAMKSEPMIDGVLLIDKAPAMTSHDVVAITRRVLNTRKVGHCGTLDPLATGLLIITIGRGTKIQDLLMSEDKEYVGTIRLGQTTGSQDADGEILEEKPVPDLTREQIDAAFGQFKGDFYQTPPMVSAIKKDGVPLYKLARQGKTIEREPRLVHIYGHEILKVDLPEVEFRVVCSKGFYVRTYAHDIGQLLGCGGHLKALRRTASGKFRVDGVLTVEELRTLPLDAIKARIMSLPEVSRLRGV
jgi:tRNA pseudouridine55 synthase